MLTPTLNSQAEATVTHVGTEQAAVIVIDDLLQAPQQVIHHAQGADFAPDATSTYPGVRAPLPEPYTAAVIEAIVPLLRATYDIPSATAPRHVGFLSLVATPAERLRVMQRLPHFDSRSPHYFAITHYLSPGAFGGTGLYRHRPTGFESISDARFNDFCLAGETWLRMHGEPPAAYINGSTDHFERYHTIDYRPNRLVAYRGWLLHSGLIKPERDVSADPATGRLTANVFVEFA